MADHQTVLPGVSVEDVLQRVLTTTQRLLGATIAVSDEDWQRPTSLPGWTRAHVASHLARNADALRVLAGNVVHHGDREPYPLDPAWEIERGSERGALDLQIDLDTSAGRLADAFEAVGEAGLWESPVTLPSLCRATARDLPLARLSEVTLHHVDMDLGFTTDDVSAEDAGWILQLRAHRLTDLGFEPFSMRSDDGQTFDVSGGGRVVTGSRQQLLGWVTCRRPDAPVVGADGLDVPVL